MGIVGLLVIVLIVLGIAAVAKYLMSGVLEVENSHAVVAVRNLLRTSDFMESSSASRVHFSDRMSGAIAENLRDGRQPARLDVATGGRHQSGAAKTRETVTPRHDPGATSKTDAQSH